MRFDGLRTLVVEDNALLAMMLEDMLLGMGCSLAGSAANTAEAVRLARELDLDFAVLDLNIDGELSYPVADVLRQRGIPHLFATGYSASSLPARFSETPMLAKPYMAEELQQAMAGLLNT